MAKDLENTILFDIYAPLLTEKQRDTLDLYYNDDLSLGEIAEQSDITRQAVLNCIHAGEVRLAELEQLMGLADRFRKISKQLDTLEELADSEPEIYEISERIRKLL